MMTVVRFFTNTTRADASHASPFGDQSLLLEIIGFGNLKPANHLKTRLYLSINHFSIGFKYTILPRGCQFILRILMAY
jgi:hypothetical protein